MSSDTTPATVEALKLAEEAKRLAKKLRTPEVFHTQVSREWEEYETVKRERMPSHDALYTADLLDALAALAHQPPAAVQAKRERLTADEVIAEWSRPCYPGDIHIASAFEAGVRFAERHFGIGAAGEGAEQ